MFSHLTSIILNISLTVLFFPEIYSVICFQFFSGYIKNFEVFDPHRVGKITVELQGRIKDCKALTYRQDLRATEIEKYRTRMLPTRQVFFNSYLVQLWKFIWSVSCGIVVYIDTGTDIVGNIKVKIWRIIVCSFKCYSLRSKI